MNFKRFIISFGVSLAFIFYVIFARGGFAETEREHRVIPPVISQTPNPITPAPSPTPAPAPSPNPTPTPAPTPAPAPKPAGQYKDGRYTGSVADAYYGLIQVQAVISGGKLTNVIFLQYPSDRQTSIMINSQAMPYLKQEAIAAQSGNVNIVSGATDSSLAFRQSMSSALALAKN